MVIIKKIKDKLLNSNLMKKIKKCYKEIKMILKTQKILKNKIKTK